MTKDQFNLMRTAAQSLLNHRDAGRKCDREAVQWAEDLLRANPEPKVTPTETSEPNQP